MRECPNGRSSIDVTTIADLEAPLPWGLHDAHLEAVEIDWPAARMTLAVRVAFGEHQEEDRRAKITVDGLLFCTMDPPRIDQGYEPVPESGLWIDVGEGPVKHSSTVLPPIPPGFFLCHLFVQSWNSFIHVCGKNARLEWLEPHSVPSRSTTRALFAGDEIPDERLKG